MISSYWKALVRLLFAVVAKTCEPMKSSLVWTLCGTQSSKNDGDSLHHQKVFPQLFPWKRATNWRSFMHNPASISNNSSFIRYIRVWHFFLFKFVAGFSFYHTYLCLPKQIYLLCLLSVGNCFCWEEGTLFIQGRAMDFHFENSRF